MELVKDTKFGMNVFNKELLNAAKCQVYSFYWFWIIKGKPTAKVNPLLLPLHPDKG